ncbi:MAG: pyridoxamine 5'-phosphate oxidase family protein [Anaerolineales bacterium]|nr:pyridoxamine 5'-phosphate oxidase family protein [Anaerolineales bacterium]
MKLTNKVLKAYLVFVLFFSILTGPASLLAQEKQMVTAERDTLIAVARKLMASARYCALITIDSTGHPQARAMEPFPPEDDMTVWFGTKRTSRKVQEIRNNPRVALYYADCQGDGYLTISGTAKIVDDPEEKARCWRESWESFYPEREKNYSLIKVSPKQLELLSIKHGITGNEETWRIPSLDF